MATYTTKRQRAVLDCLSERADAPVSAAAIVDALREQGEHIGIATVYRQLEKLERRGSVHTVTTDEGLSCHEAMAVATKAMARIDAA